MVDTGAKVNSYEISGMVDELIARYPALEGCRQAILRAFTILRETFIHKGKLLICGNGGSAADAEHISGELMKGFRKKRPLSEEYCSAILSGQRGETAREWVDLLQRALPAYPLTINGGLATAIANDLKADLIFAQQVLGYGLVGDALLAISTSGNSPNIIKAALVAKGTGIKVIGMTGSGGGLLKQYCDVVIEAPAQESYEIQEFHLPVYHCLCAMLEEEFFSENA